MHTGHAQKLWGRSSEIHLSVLNRHALDMASIIHAYYTHCPIKSCFWGQFSELLYSFCHAHTHTGHVLVLQLIRIRVASMKLTYEDRPRKCTYCLSYTGTGYIELHLCHTHCLIKSYFWGRSSELLYSLFHEHTHTRHTVSQLVRIRVASLKLTYEDGPRKYTYQSFTHWI